MRKLTKFRKVVALLLIFTMLFSSQVVTVTAAEGEATQQEQTETNFFRNLIDKILDFFRRILAALGDIFGVGGNDEPDDNESGGNESNEPGGNEQSGTEQGGEAAEFYVSLPITIRDYAADGMLFEWNENGTTGDAVTETETVDEEYEETLSGNIILPDVVSTNIYTNCSFESGLWTADIYNNNFILYNTKSKAPATCSNWYCIVCDADGFVVKTIPVGVDKGSIINEYMPDDGFFILAFCNSARAVLEPINENTKDLYQISYTKLTNTTAQFTIKKYADHIDSNILANGVSADMIIPPVDEDASGEYDFLYNSSWNNATAGYCGLRVYEYGQSISSSNLYWHCVICDSDGIVKKVLPSGASKGTTTSGDYANNMQSGYFAVWTWSGHDQFVENQDCYVPLSAITEETKDHYKISYNISTGKLNITKYTGAINADLLANGTPFVPSGTVTQTRPVEITKKYQNGNNLGYGLLQTSNASHINNLSGDTISGSSVLNRGDWNQQVVEGTELATLNSNAEQTVYGALLRTDIIEPRLDSNKNIVYTQATVDYLADYLERTLPEGWGGKDSENENTYVYNMWYVMGTKMFDDNNNYVGIDLPSQETVNENEDDQNRFVAKEKATATRDLADVLRSLITSTGTYAESKQKYNSGNLSLLSIETYYDAAYYLLHNIFDDEENGGYGMTIPEYKTLRLVQKSEGEKGTDSYREYYVFNSGYNDTQYDLENNTIYNTNTTDLPARQVSSGDQYVRGNKLPVNRFDPIGPYMGYGYNADKYEEIYKRIKGNNEYYYWQETNYNLSLEGHAKFIYYEDNNQYFNFTGDDDVYLFINGIKVLDMGGAHSISKCGVDLKNVAEMCGLVDGMSYDFDFYYMERHGTAANFCIETNIMIIDPDMVTTKMGMQDGTSTGYGGYVNPNKPVEYGFGIENSGKDKLQDLAFTDYNLQDIEGRTSVHIGYDDIVLNSKTSIEDLYVRYYENAANTRVPTTSYYLSFEKDEFINTFISECSEGDFSDSNIENALNDAILAAYGETDQYNAFETKFDSDKFMYAFTNYNYVQNPNDPNPDQTELYKRTQAGLAAGLQDTIDEFEDTIKTVLANGIPVGSKLTVYGIFYEISEQEWEAGRTVNTNGEISFIFPNRVYTSAISVSENSTTKVLNGTADWKVQKRTTNNSDLHFYEWAGHTVNITKDELLAAFIDSENSDPDYQNIESLRNANVEIKLCSSSGSITSVNINRKASVNESNGSIDYYSEDVGDDVFYYKLIKDNVPSSVAKVNMFVYDVDDNVYVLDYGLQVELNGERFGLTKNDHLYLRTNHYGTHSYLDKITHDVEKFGEFIHNTKNDSVKYKMNKFMSDVDMTNVYAVVLEDGSSAKINIDYTSYVDENGSFDVDAFNNTIKTFGVVMCEKLEVAPANVMYYEDDFPSLVYVNNADTVGEWVTYTSMKEDGTVLAGTEQSPDQSLNFGYDPNYSTGKSFGLDENGNTVVEGWLQSENENGGRLEGDASNGTIKELEVKVTGEVLNFCFRGTGFEIIARGLKEDYGIFSVKVEKILKDENGEYLTDSDGNVMVETPAVKTIPVIMQATGEDLYQTPVMSIKGLALDDYKVTVLAAGSSRVVRKVYIDGIRIFNPLSNEKAVEYYPPDEYQAKYYQIKDLINGDTTTIDSKSTNESDPHFILNEDYYKQSDWANETPEWKYTVIDLAANIEKDGNKIKLTDIVSDIVITPAPSDFRTFFIDISYISCFDTLEKANNYVNRNPNAYNPEFRQSPTEILDCGDIAENPSIRIDVEAIDKGNSITEGFNRIKTLNSAAYIAYEALGTHTVEEMRYCVIKYRTYGTSNGKQSIALRTVGQAVFADILTARDVITPQTRGTTLIEDLESVHTLVTTHNNSTYLYDGPNNEIYLEGDSGFSAIAFYLYPDSNFKEEERTIQVEAHRKIEPSYLGQTGNATLLYGSSSYSILAADNKISITSGTEQYFTIDPQNLEYDEENGRYLVYIAAGESKNYSNALALSTLKICGYTVGF